MIRNCLFLLFVLLGFTNGQTPPCTEYNIESESSCEVACGNVYPPIFRRIEVINGTHLLKIRSCVCNLDMFCLDHKVVAPMISPEGRQQAIDDHAIQLSSCRKLGVQTDGMCSKLCDETFPTNTGYTSHIHDQLVSCRCALRWGDDPVTVCVDTPEDLASGASALTTTVVAALSVVATMLFTMI